MHQLSRRGRRGAQCINSNRRARCAMQQLGPGPCPLEYLSLHRLVIVIRIIIIIIPIHFFRPIQPSRELQHCYAMLQPSRAFPPSWRTPSSSCPSASSFAQFRVRVGGFRNL